MILNLIKRLINHLFVILIVIILLACSSTTQETILTTEEITKLVTEIPTDTPSPSPTLTSTSTPIPTNTSTLTPTSTATPISSEYPPSPELCQPNHVIYNRITNTDLPDYMQITGIESHLIDEQMTITFHLKDIPEELEFGRKGTQPGYVEYSYGVCIDLDNNSDTGVGEGCGTKNSSEFYITLAFFQNKIINKTLPFLNDEWMLVFSPPDGSILFYPLIPIDSETSSSTSLPVINFNSDIESIKLQINTDLNTITLQINPDLTTYYYSSEYKLQAINENSSLSYAAFDNNGSGPAYSDNLSCAH